MVARICEALALRRDERVLDVGTGSGYQAAVLAELAAEVVTIERIPELAEQARANLAAAGYEQVEVHRRRRLARRARARAVRRDRRRRRGARAAGDALRAARAGGRLVVPVGGRRAQRLEVIVRSPEGPAVVHSVPCRFVPLVGEEGFAA